MILYIKATFMTRKLFKFCGYVGKRKRIHKPCAYVASYLWIVGISSSTAKADLNVFFSNLK